MKVYFFLCIIICLGVSISDAAYGLSYTVTSFYSNDGMPVPESDSSELSSVVPTQNMIKSKGECIHKLNDITTENYVLGKALSIGATLITLKCVKTWQYKDCEGPLNIACIGHADIGEPKQIYVYTDGAIVPRTFRLTNAGNYEVLRTISFSKKYNKNKDHDIVFGAQTRYDKQTFERLLGKPVSCRGAINDPKLQAFFRNMYFKDQRVGPFLLTCFSVNSKGVILEEGHTVVRRP